MRILSRLAGNQTEVAYVAGSKLSVRSRGELSDAWETSEPREGERRRVVDEHFEKRIKAPTIGPHHGPSPLYIIHLIIFCRTQYNWLLSIIICRAYHRVLALVGFAFPYTYQTASPPRATLQSAGIWPSLCYPEIATHILVAGFAVWFTGTSAPCATNAINFRVCQDNGFN